MREFGKLGLVCAGARLVAASVVCAEHLSKKGVGKRVGSHCKNWGFAARNCRRALGRAAQERCWRGRWRVAGLVWGVLCFRVCALAVPLHHDAGSVLCVILLRSLMFKVMRRKI